MSELNLLQPEYIAGAWFFREILAVGKWGVEKFIAHRIQLKKDELANKKELAEAASKSETEKLLSKTAETLAQVNTNLVLGKESLDKIERIVEENKNHAAEIWREQYQELKQANIEFQAKEHQSLERITKDSLTALAGNRELLSLALTQLEQYDGSLKATVESLERLQSQ